MKLPNAKSASIHLNDDFDNIYMESNTQHVTIKDIRSALIQFTKQNET